MRTIAIEEHCTTQMHQELTKGGHEYRDFYIGTRGEAIGHDIDIEQLDIGASRIAHMDATGVDVQVLSFGAPGTQIFEADVAIPMARDANEKMYAAMQAYPGRFEAFAALATADPEAAADELERTVVDWGFKGTMLNGHQRGEFLDKKKFWPIFERAAKLDVPVYLHPTYPPLEIVKCYFDEYEDLARAAHGFQIDTSTQFLRMVFSGVFDEYPNLKFILGHLGEALPFSMHRMNDHTYHSARKRGLAKEPIDYLRDNLVVTTSGNWHIPSFLCTLQTLGADNILFAIDWPYEANKTGMAYLNSLPISEDDRAKIAHGNAERLLKL